ncbi:MAG: hypothetical protein M3R04_00700, partial [bacterium]|nr:hypothetical protein [bacterium]
MLRTMVYTLALLLLAQAATFAAELSDEEYVTRAFGTVAVLHSPRQIVDPNLNWWGEKAAPELGNPAYLTGIINSRRMDKGITPLLDPNDGGTVVMETEETDAAGFRYLVSFAGMRPSEVQALVEVLGGAARMLPGATSISYEPLERRYIYASSYDGAPLVLQIGATRIERPASADFDEMRSAVDGVLRGMFGKAVPYDFTMSRATLMDG